MKLFQIMPCRFLSLQSTIDGYERTKTPLISFNDACNLGENAGIGPAGLTEEAGAYYFIPKLVELTGLNLEILVYLFYGGIVTFAFFAGAIGSWKYCSTQLGRWISLLGLFILSIVIAGISDIYVVVGASTVSLVPWLLYVQKHHDFKRTLIYFIVAGFVIGFSHSVRNHGGTGVLIFIIFSILFTKKYSIKNRASFSAALMIGLLVVSIFFGLLMKQRDDYLSTIEYAGPITSQRVFWHNVYYSLGYLNNWYGYDDWTDHEPSDTYSVRKVLSINPDVKLFSAEYESILKQEYIKFVKSHPFFVLQTIFAKLGVLLMYVLIFANVGLVLAIYYPQGTQFNLLFVAGMGFNMLFGLLATPDYQYLMGLFAFATLYGVFSIDYAVEHGVLHRFKISNKSV